MSASPAFLMALPDHELGAHRFGLSRRICRRRGINNNLQVRRPGSPSLRYLQHEQGCSLVGAASVRRPCPFSWASITRRMETGIFMADRSSAGRLYFGGDHAVPEGQTTASGDIYLPCSLLGGEEGKAYSGQRCFLSGATRSEDTNAEQTRGCERGDHAPAGRNASDVAAGRGVDPPSTPPLGAVAASAPRVATPNSDDLEIPVFLDRRHRASRPVGGTQ